MSDQEFEPRRAEPGMTFTYVGTVTKTLDEGEDPPDGATMLGHDPENPDVRQYQLVGVPIDLTADDNGVVQPKNSQEVALLDSFGLKVARKLTAKEEKAAEAAQPPAAPEAPKEG